jgi:hypothetical protein
MLTATQVLAEGQIRLTPGGELAGVLETITIGGIIAALIVLAMIIAAIVFFFMLIIGGIKWITSGGDKAQAESARNQITAALIGLVIVFAAWAIASLINYFFGIDIFNLNIRPAAEFNP